MSDSLKPCWSRIFSRPFMSTSYRNVARSQAQPRDACLFSNGNPNLGGEHAFHAKVTIDCCTGGVFPEAPAVESRALNPERDRYLRGVSGTIDTSWIAGGGFRFGLLAQKLHIAYPILLVLGGLVLGLIPGLPRVDISPGLSSCFSSLPCCFSSVLTSWRDFRANLRPILLLASAVVVHHRARGCLGPLFHRPALGGRIGAGRNHFSSDAIAVPIGRTSSVSTAHRDDLEGEAWSRRYRPGGLSLRRGSRDDWVLSLAHASTQFCIVAVGARSSGWLWGGSRSSFIST